MAYINDVVISIVRVEKKTDFIFKTVMNGLWKDIFPLFNTLGIQLISNMT